MTDKILPREAVEFFRRKSLKATDHWTDLWHGEHARFFTVARSVYADILTDIYNEIDKAIESGETLRDFQKNLKPVLQRKGWWGKTEDGVQLGSMRRLRTIYDTNLRAAYAAGRWERIQRRKDYMPYLQFIIVDDNRTRASHRVWANKVYRVDDPIWNKIYPPLGWNCRCIVRQLSRAEVEARGLKVETGPELQYVSWLNRKTGQVQLVPYGIDPGFDYNVGKANLRVKSREQVADKAASWPAEIIDNTVRNMVKDEDFADFYEAPSGYYVVAAADDLIKKTLKTEVSAIYFSDESLIKNKRHHPDLKLEDYQNIPEVARDYDYLVQDTEKSVVAVKEIKDKKYWLAVKITRKGDEIFTQSYHLTYEAQIKSLLRKGKRLK